MVALFEWLTSRLCYTSGFVAGRRSVMDMLPVIVDRIAALDTRCKRLPKQLKEWDAYTELRSAVTEFQEVLILSLIGC